MTKEYVVKITDDVIPDGFARFEDEYSPELELVRCKDCKYAMNFKNGFKYICDKEEIKIRDPNWFCADGERRDKDDG